MNYGRMELILQRAIEYICDHAYDDEELATALYKHLGMNNVELEDLGFEDLVEDLLLG